MPLTEQLLMDLAGGRRIVELEHARQRVDGELGVVRRAGAIVALCAHRCELSGLPPGLAALRQLERLDLGANQLVELPALPLGLRELYVHDNRLARLPALPPALRVLDANRNRLSELPPLADLDFVYLAGNQLTAAPVSSGVRYLNLGGNPLRAIELADRALRELRLEDAGLRAVPLSLARLVGLRELSLRGNAIASLPAGFAALTELRVLDLRGNQLEELPDALRELPLVKLDLRWNPLRRRPPWLEQLAARGCLVYS